MMCSRNLLKQEVREIGLNLSILGLRIGTTVLQFRAGVPAVNKDCRVVAEDSSGIF